MMQSDGLMDLNLDLDLMDLELISDKKQQRKYVLNICILLHSNINTVHLHVHYQWKGFASFGNNSQPQAGHFTCWCTNLSKPHLTSIKKCHVGKLSGAYLDRIVNKKRQKSLSVFSKSYSYMAKHNGITISLCRDGSQYQRLC